MSERGYTKQRRAQQEARTRERIVAATVDLHGSVGPRATTISAIAERAGVQRLTVYRHFPDQDALFRACSSHWLAAYPPPDPAARAEVADPGRRRRALLEDLYGYYRQTADMWHLSYRDVDEVPALQGPMDEFERYLATFRDALLACRPAAAGPPDRRLGAVTGHAVAFRTWESLAGEGLGDREIAALVQAWFEALESGANA